MFSGDVAARSRIPPEIGGHLRALANFELTARKQTMATDSFGVGSGHSVEVIGCRVGLRPHAGQSRHSDVPCNSSL